MELHLPDSEDLWRSLIEQLSTDARLLVAKDWLELSDPVQEDTLQKLDADFRSQLSEGQAVLDLASATWASKAFYAICCLVTQRQFTYEDFEGYLKLPPEPATAEEMYSVDLWFHLMPQLVKIVRIKSKEDPLLEYLRKLLERYPLSAIGTGMGDPMSDQSEVVLRHSGLALTLTDRVFLHEDWRWLENPKVLRQAKAIIGDHREHFQTIYKQIEHYESNTRANITETP